MLCFANSTPIISLGNPPPPLTESNLSYFRGGVFLGSGSKDHNPRWCICHHQIGYKNSTARSLNFTQSHSYSAVQQIFFQGTRSSHIITDVQTIQFYISYLFNKAFRIKCMRAAFPANHSSWFNHPHNMNWRMQTVKSLMTHFSNTSFLRPRSVFWRVMLCGPAGGYQRFERTYHLYLPGWSPHSITTQRPPWEHPDCRKNFKCHIAVYNLINEFIQNRSPELTVSKQRKR
jgi:hypothetical protein